MKKILFALTVGLAATAHAEKMPIVLQCNVVGSDSIGYRICSGLRDAFARSPRYREAFADEEGFKAGINVQSQAIEDTGISAQSVVYTAITGDSPVEIYLGSWVTYTGEEMVERQVQRIMAGFDGQMQTIRDAPHRSNEPRARPEAKK